MIQKFNDLPINKKISTSILITTMSALLICAVSTIGYELKAFRKAAMESLIALAEIVGGNSSGALSFNDEAGATQILANLRLQKPIIAAHLYKLDGTVFASFFRDENHSRHIPSAPRSHQNFISDGHLKVFRMVRFREDPIGTIYIESDMSRINQRLFGYIGIVCVILLLLFPLAFLLSRFFERIISNPIKKLANVAQEIATNKNYTIRATQQTADEIGRLTSVFNHMLDSLEERDRKLVDQSEQLWRSNKELEQFAYVSSHDLQEPLRKITTYSQLLEMKFKNGLNEEGCKYLDNICVCASRMRPLISDLLTYSRLSNQEIKLEPVNLNKTLANVLNDLEPSILETKATIKSQNLPVIMANNFQINQLFQNLLSNAIKFHRDAPPQIEITCEGKTPHWIIGIHDNGIGIDTKYADQIFKVFHRLHAREAYPGTGIGLAICKKIVEQNGGKIWVESQPMAGSHFFFSWLMIEKQSLAPPLSTVEEQR